MVIARVMQSFDYFKQRVFFSRVSKSLINTRIPVVLQNLLIFILCRHKVR